MFTEKESEAGDDMDSFLARSQSSRNYQRPNLGLDNFFQRNTPRSKSLGRPGAKGTRVTKTHLFGLGGKIVCLVAVAVKINFFQGS